MENSMINDQMANIVKNMVGENGEGINKLMGDGMLENIIGKNGEGLESMIGFAEKINNERPEEMNAWFNLVNQMIPDDIKNNSEYYSPKNPGDMISQLHEAKKAISQNNQNPNLEVIEDTPKNRRKHKRQETSKCKDSKYDIDVSLKELYNGIPKKTIRVTASRIEKDEDGENVIVNKKNKIRFEIPPGAPHGNTFTYPGGGDHLEGREPGDVIITINETPDPDEIFTRKENNLYLDKQISLYEAFKCSFTFKHMDDRIIKINSIDGDILYEELLDSGEAIRKIKGEGMPILNSEDEKGDLFIRFNLKLPETDDLADKTELLKKLFPPINNPEESVSDTHTWQHISEKDNIFEYDTDSDDIDEDDEDFDSDDSSDGESLVALEEYLQQERNRRKK